MMARFIPQTTAVCSTARAWNGQFVRVRPGWPVSAPASRVSCPSSSRTLRAAASSAGPDGLSPACCNTAPASAWPCSDPLLAAESPLRGRIAIASARVAYQRYLAAFRGPAWERLQRLGARARTGTKNPDYSDVRYVAELIGPGVINTMPDHTLHAFGDHGTIARTLDAEPEDAERTLAAAAAETGLAALTAQLERDGVSSFCDSYHQLLGCIERKLAAGAAAA
jgi:hypothetical protein